MRKKFSIEDFLNTNHIQYIDHGVNVKKGEINIRCPYCGDDPSMHLGVDEERLVFSCWRNASHRGKLHKLIMLLGRCSFATACEILGQNSLWFDKGEFDLFMNDPEGFFNPTEKVKKVLKVNPFKDYSDAIPDRFVDYMVSRGFFRKHIPKLFEDYKMQYCTEGLYKNRIVLPIFMRGEQVTFTSRAIGEGIRYLSLSEDQGAIESIKETLFNFDNMSGEILFLCEGPLDALKLDFYGKKLGCRATCLFGKNIKANQVLLLDELLENFNKLVILLDNTEFDSSLRIDRLLSFIKKPVVIGHLPEGVSDPGDLSIIQVKQLCEKYL